MNLPSSQVLHDIHHMKIDCKKELKDFCKDEALFTRSIDRPKTRFEILMSTPGINEEEMDLVDLIWQECELYKFPEILSIVSIFYTLIMKRSICKILNILIVIFRFILIRKTSKTNQ